MSTSTSTSPAADPRERAAALLTPGATVSGFTVISNENIPELDADAYVLTHEASGARLLYLPCDDENKAFAIGFKTPPTDDTGVFHILEHSVLCGSAKFPVKEPFVDLIKTSMQTFLNAMTYPDKTVYPVASTNEQDLLNLMDVYMDAVLNPAIYTKRAIFEQEGWHLELDVPEDGTLREGTLRYNGVVFNEMKGALSDPMSVLDNAINARLFPDTAYSRESGGNPRAIPTLTYEQFLDTHARHYNLANSHITLYGDLDVVRVLAFLDERYLSDAARAAASEAKIAAGTYVEAPGAPNPLDVQAPVTCDYARVEMDTTPENALVGLAHVLGGALDRKTVIAADVLIGALFGSNEAPIKKALLAAGLGGDVTSYVVAEVLQPYQLIILQQPREGAAAEFRAIIEREVRRLVDEGIPRERLEAVLSNNEYQLRQRDYGVADGVAIACDAFSTWLYDDDAALGALTYGPIYQELRQELDGRYFEELLGRIVLKSEHCALVELVATQGAGAADAPEGAMKPEGVAEDPGEAAELAALMASMSDEELKHVVDNVAHLRAHQEAEDSPEARATLPSLCVSDIGEARPEPDLVIDTTRPLPCLVHDIPTHRLAYAIQYFDLSHVSYAELPYVNVLAKLLGELATERRSADELDSYIDSNLGFLSFKPEVISRRNWKLARPVLTVAAGALSEKIEYLAAIPREVWATTRFEDTERVRDRLTQMRIGMERYFLMNGNAAAVSRAMSYVSPAAVVAEQLQGVDFYRFLRDLLEHFDERAEDLMERLRELSGRIFTSTNLITSFTGSAEDCARYWDAAGTLGLEKRTAAAKELYVPFPEPRNEAFIIPSDICYVGQATDPRALNLELDGTWNIVSSALSYDYLWNEIRVKGGAYGCGFRAAGTRQVAFSTYRDPGIDPSIERFAHAGEWLAAFDPEPAAFEGLIVSGVAKVDAPVKPYALGRRLDMAYLSEVDPDARAKRRARMLATSPEELRALAPEVTRLAEVMPRCVFGGREIIEQSKLDWNVIDLLA